MGAIADDNSFDILPLPGGFKSGVDLYEVNVVKIAAYQEIDHVPAGTADTDYFDANLSIVRIFFLISRC
jgi:hypothetical protein